MITWNFINREKEDYDKTTLISIKCFLNWRVLVLQVCQIENFFISIYIERLLALLSLSC